MVAINSEVLGSCERRVQSDVADRYSSIYYRQSFDFVDVGGWTTLDRDTVLDLGEDWSSEGVFAIRVPTLECYPDGGK